MEDNLTEYEKVKEQNLKLSKVLDKERKKRIEERRKHDDEREAYMLLKHYTSLFTDEVPKFVSFTNSEKLTTVIMSLEEYPEIKRKYEGDFEKYKEQKDKEMAIRKENLERVQLLNTRNEEHLKTADIAMSNMRIELVEKNAKCTKTVHQYLQRIDELEKKLSEARNAETAKINLLREEWEKDMRARERKSFELIKEQEEMQKFYTKELGQQNFERRKLEYNIESLISELAVAKRQKKELEQVKELMERKEEEWKRIKEQIRRRIAESEELFKEAFHSEMACKDEVITLQAHIVELESCLGIGCALGV